MKHLYTWTAITVIVFASVVGDVFMSRAMKQVGDVHDLLQRRGFWIVVGRTLSNPNFFLGVTSIAVAFFSLLFALSWAAVSLVAPASSSWTFICNACAARGLRHEKVGRRWWMAASSVAGGV